MLAPRNRALVLESLRPPVGYQLDQAVATSFSLDLLALLTAPLAFTFFDWEDEDGKPSADPLALLEAVRCNAKRIHLFSNAGSIQVPQKTNALFAYLESSVHEVKAPLGGVFHPKLWVLRFVGDSDEPVRYRVIVPTRNLTFDRSWDTVLVLDGELSKRKRAIGQMKPLADLISALPELAVQSVHDECRKAVALVADEIQRVELELPEQFDELHFHPLGLRKQQTGQPFASGNKHLVISPFLSDGFFNEFLPNQGSGVLISRSDSLLATEESSSEGFGQRFILAAEADPEENGENEDLDVGDDGQDLSGEGSPPSGLHAKLFLIERARRAHLFTGSANATHAAFHRNVEILVELVGGQTRHGIQALLNPEVSGSLRDLLEEWSPPSELELDPNVAIAKKLEQALGQVRDAFVDSGLELDVNRVDDSDSFDLSLLGDLPELEGLELVQVWPASLQQQHAKELLVNEVGSPVIFRVPLPSLTAFLCVELVASENGVRRRLRTCMRLPLLGVPEDREQLVLRSLLGDKQTVLRLLFLLLSGEDLSVSDFAEQASGGNSSARHHAEFGLPLLEAMVRALDRDPSSLDSVRRLVEDLQSSEEGRQLLPDGFFDIWNPVCALAEEVCK